MKVEICNKDLEIIAKVSQDALLIASEFATATTKEINKLHSAVENLKISSSNNSDYDAKRINSLEARLEKLEMTISNLQSFLLEKTPTGKDKLTKAGSRVAKIWNVQVK